MNLRITTDEELMDILGVSELRFPSYKLIKNGYMRFDRESGRLFVTGSFSLRQLEALTYWMQRYGEQL